MTGGQHSVTTPAAAWTTTTPWGNVERPMDLCATAAAAGAAWVYRATVFDKDLSDLIARAVAQPGFAMVDVWEPCTAYYGARNEGTKKEILGLAERLGMKLGQIAADPRPEYSASYREAFGHGRARRGPKPGIEVSYASTVECQTGIVIAGSAGQKVKSSATLIAQAAIASGLSATQKDDYPITVMTGHSLAEVILSPDAIEYTGIEHPDHLLLLSADGLARIRARAGALPETTTIHAEETLELPRTRARVLRYPFVKTARKVDRNSIGIVAGAALLEQSRLFPNEALEATIRTFQGPEIAETNVAALAAGRALVGAAES